MISAPDLTFKDGLIRVQSKTPDSKAVESFSLDFSPAVGRISKIIPLTRYQHLINLSLVGHGFSDITALDNLSKLQKLNLSYNSIFDFTPLLKLTNLETLNISHNKITFIPKKSNFLTNLHSLNISFNRISDITTFQNLKENHQLQNLVVEGNSAMNDENSVSFIVFSLTQLTVLNNQRIQRDLKVQATQQYSNTNPIPVYDETREYIDSTPFKVFIQESQNKQLSMIHKIRETEMEHSNIKSDLDYLKAEVALSKTISFRKPDSDEINALKVKNKKLKQKVLTALSDKTKAEEELELEKTLLLKQRQMYSRLSERYQNERRSKEPKQISKTPSKSIPHSSELRLPILLNENRKLQQTIEAMKDTERFHIAEISSQRKQIEQLISQQSEFMSSQNQTHRTTTTINNSNETETIIKDLNYKINQLKEENEKKAQEISKQSASIYRLQEQNDLSSTQIVSSLNTQLESLKGQLQQKDDVIQKVNMEKHSLQLEIDHIKMANKVLETTKEEFNHQLEKYQSKISGLENEKIVQAENIHKIQEYAEKFGKLNESSTEKNNKLKQQISDLKLHINELKSRLSDTENQLHKAVNDNDELNKQIKEMNGQINQMYGTNDNKILQMQKDKEDFIAKLSLEIKARDEKIQSLTKLFKDSFHLDSLSIENLTSKSVIPKMQKENEENSDKILKYETITNELRQKLDTTIQKLSNVETENISIKEKYQNLQKDHEISQNQAKQIIEKVEHKIMKQKKLISKLEIENKILNKRFEGIPNNNNNIMNSDNNNDRNNYNSFNNINDHGMSFKQQLIERDVKIEELSNKLQVQSRESEAKIALLTENNNKLQLKITETQQIQFSLITNIQNIITQFENSTNLKINLTEINQTTLIQISQFFMNIQLEYKNMKEKHDKALNKIQENKKEIIQKEDSFQSKQKEIERLDKEKSETETKYKSVLEENSKLRQNIQESHSQIQDLSLQLSQLENSTSDISSIHENYYPDEIKRLKKTKHQMKQDKMSLEQQIKSLNKTVYEKSAEIDQLKSNLQNSELYRSEIAGSIETNEQRNQIRIASLQKEMAETENMLTASRSREEIMANDNDRLHQANTKLIEKLKKAHRKLENKKFLTKQLEMAISQQKTVSQSITAQKDQKNEQNTTLIMTLKDELNNITHQNDTENISYLSEKQELEINYQNSQRNIQKLKKKVIKLTSFVQELDQETKNANQTIQNLKKELKEANETLRGKDINVLRATEQRDTTEHLFKALTVKYNDLRNEFERYKIAVDSKEEQIEYIKQIEMHKKENKKLNKELVQLQSHEKAFNEAHSELCSKIAQLEDQVKDSSEQKKNSDILIEKYSSKINELQKTIQILQSHCDESSHLTDSLASKIFEAKENMIEKSQHEELQQKYENLYANKKALKLKFKEIIVENGELKKSLDSKQTEIKLFKDKMSQEKSNLSEKIEELKKVVMQKQSEFESNEKQKKDMKSELKKLRDHIEGLAKESKMKENKVSKISEKLTSETQKNDQIIKELKDEIEKKQNQIVEQESIISELQTDLNQTEEEKNKEEQSNTVKISEYEKIKTELELKNDQLIKDLTKYRKESLSLQSEIKKNQEVINEKEFTIQELTNKVDKSVPLDNFNKLLVKYETTKKLLKFNEGKLQTASYDKSLKSEQMKKEFEEKEERMKEANMSLNKEISENKELIRKLRIQVQNLNKRVEILSNPDSELCPIGELKLCEERLKSKEIENDSLKDKINDLSKQNDSLVKKASDQQTSIHRFETKVEEMSHSIELMTNEKKEAEKTINDFSELTKAVYHSFLKNRILHSNSISEKLNSLFNYAKLNSVSFYEPQLSLKSSTIHQISPTFQEKINKQKAIIRDIKTHLTSFPLESHFSNTKEIEDELLQISSFLSSLKDVFDDQMSHFQEVSEILSSQHHTSIKMSDQSVGTITKGNM